MSKKGHLQKVLSKRICEKENSKRKQIAELIVHRERRDPLFTDRLGRMRALGYR